MARSRTKFPFRRNVGTIDAVIRVLGGVVVVIHAFLATESILGSLAELSGALILLATAVTRWCPVYEALRRRLPASDR